MLITIIEGGADIRYVQELLGHRDLSSTHIYTRVAPERLAAIHAATHPGAIGEDLSAAQPAALHENARSEEDDDGN